MTEAQKALTGELYDANYDPSLINARLRTKGALKTYNDTDPGNLESRTAQLKALLGRTAATLLIEQPFRCDYGHNIEVGDNFYANFGLVILDANKVIIGDNVFIGPNVGLHTSGHPLDAKRRNAGLEYARPISIGNSVWIGAGVQVMPGVTIGHNSVIGAGSVVTRDIPPDVVAAGVPCRVLKSIVNLNNDSKASTPSLSTMTTPVRLRPAARYSEVVIHNGTAYLAGQVPENTSSDIRGQTQEVLGMIDALLSEAGSDKSRLLSAQIFLRDIADIDAMNIVWDAWVTPGSAPARATVQASLADPAWLIEVVVTAAV
jgi:maltose O-acetyltransferase